MCVDELGAEDSLVRIEAKSLMTFLLCLHQSGCRGYGLFGEHDEQTLYRTKSVSNYSPYILVYSRNVINTVNRGSAFKDVCWPNPPESPYNSVQMVHSASGILFYTSTGNASVFTLLYSPTGESRLAFKDVSQPVGSRGINASSGRIGPWFVSRRSSLWIFFHKFIDLDFVSTMMCLAHPVGSMYGSTGGSRLKICVDELGADFSLPVVTLPVVTFVLGTIESNSLMNFLS